MNVLDRKLFRDLSRLKGQAFTIALVVAVGVASYITLRSAWRALAEARVTYYSEYRFADAFARLKRAPDSVLDDLAAIPGVSKVYPRIVEPILLPMEGLIAPAQGELISLPDRGRPLLNDIMLKTGRLPEPGRANEIVVYEPFAKAHELAPGSRVPAILNGKLHDLTVVGTALCPEFVFAVQPGSFNSDDALFSPLWMSKASIEAAFEMEGAFNDIVLKLEPTANDDAVLTSVDRILKPYGGIGAYLRERQISHDVLEGELLQIEALVVFMPGVFLAVAAFLLNVVFSRVVALQRAQIAIIKALGYFNKDIAYHYLKMVTLIVAAGSAAGVPLGAWLGDALLDLYASLFRLPMTRTRVDLPVSINAILASFAAALLGVAVALWRAMKLPPAEAMRPPAPMRYHTSVVERVPLFRRLSQPALMVFRETWRRPLRAFLSALGISFALSIVILGRFGRDAHGPIIELQYSKVQREDIGVMFRNEVSDRGLGYLKHLPGVDQAEGLRFVPVRFRVGSRWRDSIVIGIPGDAQLRRLYERSFASVSVPHTGILITNVLADILRVRPGDMIDFELKEGDRSTKRVQVSGTIDEAFGLQGYMDKHALHRLLGEEPVVNQALLRIDPALEDEVQARLIDIRAVEAIHRKQDLLDRFEEQTANTMRVITLILTLFATAIAVSVVYNNMRVSLSLRQRDLATLRVLGFTRAEISAILLGELAIPTAIGVPIGLYLGTVGAYILVSLQADPEQFRMPALVASQTYAFAFIVVLGAALLSAMLVRRRLDQLDLISVLKTRE